MFIIVKFSLTITIFIIAAVASRFNGMNGIADRVASFKQETCLLRLLWPFLVSQFKPFEINSVAIESCTPQPQQDLAMILQPCLYFFWTIVICVVLLRNWLGGSQKSWEFLAFLFHNTHLRSGYCPQYSFFFLLYIVFLDLVYVFLIVFFRF